MFSSAALSLFRKEPTKVSRCAPVRSYSIQPREPQKSVCCRDNHKLVDGSITDLYQEFPPVRSPVACTQPTIRKYVACLSLATDFGFPYHLCYLALNCTLERFRFTCQHTQNLGLCICFLHAAAGSLETAPGHCSAHQPASHSTYTVFRW